MQKTIVTAELHNLCQSKSAVVIALTEVSSLCNPNRDNS